MKDRCWELEIRKGKMEFITNHHNNDWIYLLEKQEQNEYTGAINWRYKKKLKNTWRKYTEELYNMKNRCKEQIYVAEE